MVNVADELVQQKHCPVSLSSYCRHVALLHGFLKETAKTSEITLEELFNEG